MDRIQPSKDMPITTSERFICDFCGKEFKNRRALGGHRISHVRLESSDPNLNLHHDHLSQDIVSGEGSSKSAKKHMHIAGPEESEISVGLALPAQTSRTQNSSSIIPPLNLIKSLPAPSWSMSRKRGSTSNARQSALDDTEGDKNDLECASSLIMLASTETQQISSGIGSSENCEDRKCLPDHKEQNSPSETNFSTKYGNGLAPNELQVVKNITVSDSGGLCSVEASRSELNGSSSPRPFNLNRTPSPRSFNLNRAPWPFDLNRSPSSSSD